MVGTNLGAGQGERARRVAILGSSLAFAATQTIGLVVAIRPGLWLHLYTDVPAVLATGSVYLRVVGLAYGAFGFGFVLAFAAQGAGALFWPVCAVIARSTVGAGLGWMAVSDFGVSPSALAGMIATSLLVYAVINAIILGQRHVWRQPL
jgi:Na+-driven multidrug efflux pump